MKELLEHNRLIKQMLGGSWYVWIPPAGQFHMLKLNDRVVATISWFAALEPQKEEERERGGARKSAAIICELASSQQLTGLGIMLMRDFIGHARLEGHSAVLVNAKLEAVGWYEKFGFEAIGEEVAGDDDDDDDDDDGSGDLNIDFDLSRAARAFGHQLDFGSDDDGDAEDEDEDEDEENDCGTQQMALLLL